VLLLLGVVFLGIELFVLPGFGVAGFAGLAMIAVSLILACQNFVLPETMQELRITTGATATLVVSSLVFAAIAYAMVSYIGKIPILSGLVLAPVPSPSGEDDVDDSMESASGIPAAKKVAIGAIGKTTTILRPQRPGDHRWSADGCRFDRRCDWRGSESPRRRNGLSTDHRGRGGTDDLNWLACVLPCAHFAMVRQPSCLLLNPPAQRCVTSRHSREILHVACSKSNSLATRGPFSAPAESAP
jgi:hypothetical protein